MEISIGMFNGSRLVYGYKMPKSVIKSTINGGVLYIDIETDSDSIDFEFTDGYYPINEKLAVLEYGEPILGQRLTFYNIEFNSYFYDGKHVFRFSLDLANFKDNIRFNP